VHGSNRVEQDPGRGDPPVHRRLGGLEVDNHKFTPMSAHQFLIHLTGEKNIGPYQDKWQKWCEKNKDRFKPAP
jgi:hypothetical protein